MENKSTCTCGLAIEQGASLTLHKRSVYHRKYKRIEKLLAVPCVNLAEIGRRVGVSRERVRQIYSDILERGTGHERQESCAIAYNDHLEQNWEASLSARAQVFVAEAKQRGIQCLPIGTHHFHRLSYNKNAVTIAGRLVLIRAADDYAHRQRGLVRVTGPAARGDFAVFHLPNGLWMILPNEKWPSVSSSTMFSLEAPTGNRRGNPNRRHDWRDYIDRWDLLKVSEVRELATKV